MPSREAYDNALSVLRDECYGFSVTYQRVVVSEDGTQETWSLSAQVKEPEWSGDVARSLEVIAKGCEDVADEPSVGAVSQLSAIASDLGAMCSGIVYDAGETLPGGREYNCLREPDESGFVTGIGGAGNARTIIGPSSSGLTVTPESDPDPTSY